MRFTLADIALAAGAKVPSGAADVDLSVRFKPVSGRVDQACGLIIRAADARNYYIARSNALT